MKVSTGTSGTGIHTELTEVSGTGIDVVPTLPKCPVPVIPAVYTASIYRRYASVRTVPNTAFFVCCSKGALWIIT